MKRSASAVSMDVRRYPQEIVVYIGATADSISPGSQYPVPRINRAVIAGSFQRPGPAGSCSGVFDLFIRWNIIQLSILAISIGPYIPAPDSRPAVNSDLSFIRAPG